jgi:hypothetical protein
MKEPAPPPPGPVQRTVAALLYGIPLVCIILWMIRNNSVQIIWLLGALFLALAAIHFVAVWRHGLRWLFSLRAWRFHGWLAVGLVTLIVLFYSEESWRGKRAWAALKREVAAQGTLIDLNSLAPPAVPDDQNFARAPGIAGLLFATNGAERIYFGRDSVSPIGLWALRQSTDLAAWQKYFRAHPEDPQADPEKPSGSLRFPISPQPQEPAADVLLALSRFETNLATLEAASLRPALRLPVDYRRGFFAQEELWRPMRELRFTGRLLALRASAELALGRSEAAFLDVRTGLRIANLLRDEPSAGLQASRRTLLECCLQPVWEGLAAHAWNEEPLAALQKALEEADVVAGFKRGAFGETLALMNLVDQGLAFVTGAPSEIARRFPPMYAGERAALWTVRTLYPVGWLYQDKTWIYRFYQRHLDAFAAAREGRRTGAERLAEMRSLTDPVMLVLVVPKMKELESGAEGALVLQSFLHQAATACALERYRLAHGQYPATLEALVPAYVPQVPADFLAQPLAPLHYRRTDDGGFQLYSVGPDRTDNGGKVQRPTDPRYFWLASLGDDGYDLVWR